MLKKNLKIQNHQVGNDLVRSWTLFGPQRSIFDRFRRTRARFPSPTLYSIIRKGFLSHVMSKNRLNQMCCDKRPRTNTWFWVVTGVSRDEINSNKGPRGLNVIYFATLWPRGVPEVLIESSFDPRRQILTEKSSKQWPGVVFRNPRFRTISSVSSTLCPIYGTYFHSDTGFHRIIILKWFGNDR